MINGIYAAEFDLIKGSSDYRKGCVIKASYPEKYKEKQLLASYMIPDGVHKIKRDHFFFKLQAPRPMEGKVRVFHFNKEWLPVFKEEYADLRYIDGKIRISGNTLEWIDIKLSTANLQMVGENFITVTLNPHLKFGIQGAVVEEVFLAILRNKKDPTIKRGSLIRSIAISSNDNLFVGVIAAKLENILNTYFEQVGVEHWTEQQFKKINKQILKGILEEAYHQLKGCDLSLSYFKYSKHLLDWNSRDRPSKMEGLSYQASLIDLLQLFKMKIRFIYRAILNQRRIVFLCHDCSNTNKIQEEIYSKACNIAASLMFLAMPLNISSSIQGYKGLMDPRWGQDQKWISLVSNPIIEYRKEWWDVFCDLSTLKILETEHQGQQSVFLNNEADVDFFQSLLNQINYGHIPEIQVRQSLYNYTTTVLQNEKFVNSILDYNQYAELNLKTEGRYDRILNSLRSKLLRWYDVTHWDLFSNKEGYVVYTRTHPEIGLCISRVHTEINLKLDDVVSVLTDARRLPLYDDKVDAQYSYQNQAHIIEEIDPQTQVVYVRIKPPSFLNNCRDLVMVQRVYRNQNGQVQILSKSIHHSKAPSINKIERAEMYLSAWIITPNIQGVNIIALQCLDQRGEATHEVDEANKLTDIVKNFVKYVSNLK